MMRESDEFNAVKYWAPFMLIGDEVTLNFDQCGCGSLGKFSRTVIESMKRKKYLERG